MVAYGRIVPFIATLAMLAGARGLARDHRQPADPDHQGQGFLDFFTGSLLGIPMLVWIFALVAVAGWILLNRTTFGRRTFAVGGNPEAARLAGIRVKRQTMLLYVLVGVCCGIAARDDHGPDHDRHRRPTATLYELDAIAAVVIGGTLLSGGRGTIVGTVFGVLIFTTLTNVFTLNNLSISAQAIAKGVIIVVAVLLQQRSPPRRAATDRRPSPHQHRPHHRTVRTKEEHDASPCVPCQAASSPRPACVAGLARSPSRRAPSNSSADDQRGPRRRHAAAALRRANDDAGREGRHRLLRPGGRPRLDGLDHQVRQGRGREVLATSS